MGLLARIPSQPWENVKSYCGSMRGSFLFARRAVGRPVLKARGVRRDTGTTKREAHTIASA